MSVPSVFNGQMLPTDLGTETLKSMAAPITKKRKISCLSCRARKTKCDGQKPCAKCLLKGKSHECVYAQTTGPVGRPAKNAVVNKMVLLSQSSVSKKQQFVYENLSFTGLNNYNKIFTQTFQRDHIAEDGTKLSDYINSIFSVYFGNGLRFDDYDVPTDQTSVLVDRSESIFQLFDLKQHYSWLASEGVSNIVARISDLKLTNFRDLNVYGHLLKSDRSERFFDRQRTTTFTATVRQNPLKSLTPQQALQFIDVFFSVHPWAPFILNRTQILQEYFTDECDPLLIAVVCGVAKYFAKQMSEGIVFSTVVRRGDRNEFLNYAYTILGETSAKTTVAKFQAVTLLSYFEITYGQSKKGTTLTALSYVMLGQLSQSADFKDKNLAGLGTLHQELVRNAWWCIYNNTVTGTIEFGQVPRDALMPREIPLPKQNSDQSESYQLDKSTGNTSMFVAYGHVYESFYVASVLCKLLGKIWRVLPEPDRNMFRTNPTITQLANCPPEVQRPSLRDIILDILADFDAFITVQHKNLSEQQVYHLEMARNILFIHAYFLKPEMDNSEAMIYVSAITNVFSKIDDFEIVTKLPLGAEQLDRTLTMDANSIPDEVMKAVLPQAMEVIDKTSQFLEKREGNTELLQKAPGWIMQDCLETGALIFMIQIQRQDNVPQAVSYLEKVLKSLEVPNVYNFVEDIKRLKFRIERILEVCRDSSSTCTGSSTSPLSKTNERIPTADILSFYPTPPPNAAYDNIVKLMSMSPNVSSIYLESDTTSITDKGLTSSPITFDGLPEEPVSENQFQPSFESNGQQPDLLDLQPTYIDTPLTNTPSPACNQNIYQQSTPSPLMDGGDFADLANIDANTLAMEFGLDDYGTNLLQQHMNFDYLQEVPLDLFVLDKEQPQ